MASFFSGIILFYIVILAALSSNDGSARLVEALASSPSPKKVIRVCQSPGCKDDGALATLACLSALAKLDNKLTTRRTSEIWGKIFKK